MESRVFERKFYEKTLSRKQDKDGSTALLIKGARELWHAIRSGSAITFGKSTHSEATATSSALSVKPPPKPLGDTSKTKDKLEFIFILAARKRLAGSSAEAEDLRFSRSNNINRI